MSCGRILEAVIGWMTRRGIVLVDRARIALERRRPCRAGEPALRPARWIAPLAMVLWAAALQACATDYEVSIETPTHATLDVSAFHRVLVAGFIGAGVDGVDTNLETVRLLRSQLRSKSPLTVIEADVWPLAETAIEVMPDAGGPGPTADGPRTAALTTQQESRNEVAHDRLGVANAAFWRKVGEEYQGPLIVTGRVLLTVQSRREIVRTLQENVDSFGRRQVVGTGVFAERTVCMLMPTFVFIDGRTGEVLYSTTLQEEVSYDASENIPALSSYFELMDRVVPSVLGIVSDQTLRRSRILLK